MPFRVDVVTSSLRAVWRTPSEHDFLTKTALTKSRAFRVRVAFVRIDVRAISFSEIRSGVMDNGHE